MFVTPTTNFLKTKDVTIYRPLDALYLSFARCEDRIHFPPTTFLFISIFFNRPHFFFSSRFLTTCEASAEADDVWSRALWAPWSGLDYTSYKWSYINLSIHHEVWQSLKCLRFVMKNGIVKNPSYYICLIYYLLHAFSSYKACLFSLLVNIRTIWEIKLEKMCAVANS